MDVCHATTSIHSRASEFAPSSTTIATRTRPAPGMKNRFLHHARPLFFSFLPLSRGFAMPASPIRTSWVDPVKDPSIPLPFSFLPLAPSSASSFVCVGHAACSHVRGDTIWHLVRRTMAGRTTGSAYHPHHLLDASIPASPAKQEGRVDRVAIDERLPSSSSVEGKDPQTHPVPSPWIHEGGTTSKRGVSHDSLETRMPIAAGTGSLLPPPPPPFSPFRLAFAHFCGGKKKKKTKQEKRPLQWCKTHA